MVFFLDQRLLLWNIWYIWVIEIIFLYNIEKLWLIFLFALIFPLILLTAKMTNQLFLPRQNKIPMWKIDIYFLSLFLSQFLLQLEQLLTMTSSGLLHQK